MPEPRFLLVTTQSWTQLTRLALRFVHYGARVSALCRADNEMRHLGGLDSFHVFNPDDLMGSLQAAIAAARPTHLIPGDDLAVWLMHGLSRLSPDLEILVEQSLGPSRSFPVTRSRASLLALAGNLEIATPETAAIRTAEQARHWAREHGFPFLLKLDGTFGGGGVRLVEDQATLERQCSLMFPAERANGPRRSRLNMRRLLRLSPRELVLPSAGLPQAEVSAQTWIEGVAANVMFACDRGRILGEVQARVVASRGKTGPSLLIRTMDDSRITRAGKLLAASLELSGFFGLDFILDRDTDEPMLIEMNPRCTQLGHVCMSGQTELAGILWSAWSGSPLPPVGAPELSSRICFYPQGQISAAGSRFLASSRPDVCPEDRAAVDRLALGAQALQARILRAGHKRLKGLRNRVLPPAPPKIYYFEADAAPPVSTVSPAAPANPRAEAEPSHLAARRGSAASAASIRSAETP